MKKEQTQLQTKQLKQKTFKLMGFCKLTSLHKEKLQKSKEIVYKCKNILWGLGGKWTVPPCRDKI